MGFGELPDSVEMLAPSPSIDILKGRLLLLLRFLELDDMVIIQCHVGSYKLDCKYKKIAIAIYKADYARVSPWVFPYAESPIYLLM